MIQDFKINYFIIKLWHNLLFNANNKIFPEVFLC